MASRKEERKDEAGAAARQVEAQEILTRTLDEAKDSTRRAMEEARRDISARTASFNEYQVQTINAARDAENYIEDLDPFKHTSIYAKVNGRIESLMTIRLE